MANPPETIDLNEAFIDNDDPLHQIAWKLHTAGTGELAQGLTALELTVQLRERKAAESLATILKDKLMTDGYIVVTDIDDSLAEYEASQVLNTEVIELHPEHDDDAA